MNIFEEFRKIVTVITDNNLDYVLVGGVAMAFHGEARFTRDIDIMLLPENIEELTNLLSGIGYSKSASSWTFRSTDMTLHRFLKIEENEHMQLDVLTANMKRTRQIINNSLHAESVYGSVRVASKEDLIWMKRQRNSDQDQVDIKRLGSNGREEDG